MSVAQRPPRETPPRGHSHINETLPLVERGAGPGLQKRSLSVAYRKPQENETSKIWQ